MFDLNRDLEIAINHFPNLRIIEKNGKLCLSGDVYLFEPTENVWLDSFSVDIFFPTKFPYRFPIVYETSGKIERILNRHIYSVLGNMCFAVHADELLQCKSGITTLWFLNNVLVPRLAEEYVVNHGGNYSHGFTHGTGGDLEFYFEKFNTTNSRDVIKYLRLVLSGELPKHFKECICGSGSKFKNCHKKIFLELKSLGKEFIENEIAKLEKFVNNHE